MLESLVSVWLALHNNNHKPQRDPCDEQVHCRFNGAGPGQDHREPAAAAPRHGGNGKSRSLVDIFHWNV